MTRRAAIPSPGRAEEVEPLASTPLVPAKQAVLKVGNTFLDYKSVGGGRHHASLGWRALSKAGTPRMAILRFMLKPSTRSASSDFAFLSPLSRKRG